MTTARKTAPHEGTTTPSSRREQLVGWAELGVETAVSAQKQWNDITFAYADLALQAARNGLSWVESMYEQNRKTMAALTQARNERARAILERLG
jgi:hypothetical protein